MSAIREHDQVRVTAQGNAYTGRIGRVVRIWTDMWLKRGRTVHQVYFGCAPSSDPANASGIVQDMASFAANELEVVE